MKSPDRLSGAFFIALSVIICLGSLRLRAGTLEAPGPMIFPLLLGVGLLVCSIVFFVKARASQPAPTVLFPRDEFRAVASVTGILLLFVLIFETAGTVISIFVLMLLLMKVVGGRTMRSAALYSSIITAITYLVFVVMLGVRLPRNVLGF